MSKFTVPARQTGPHTFLHWTKTSWVKIGLPLKKSCLFQELEDMRNWYCKNYSRLLFPKVLPCRCLTRFWVCLRFWICQGSEYASGFEYARILNIPEFWICQGFTGFRICLNNSWICLNMSDYVWIFLNLPEYAWICLKSFWITFVWHSPIPPFVLQSLFYVNTWLLIWTCTGE